jgi:hypothetical protein
VRRRTRHPEEEQRQEGLAARGWGGVRQSRSHLCTSGERLLQGRDHARLVGGSEQQQTTGAILPDRLRGRLLGLIFPPRPTPGG